MELPRSVIPTEFHTLMKHPVNYTHFVCRRRLRRVQLLSFKTIAGFDLDGRWQRRAAPVSKSEKVAAA